MTLTGWFVLLPLPSPSFHHVGRWSKTSGQSDLTDSARRTDFYFSPQKNNLFSMETTRVKPSTEPLDSLLCSASSLERGKRLSLPLSLSLSRSSFVSFFLFSCSDLLESSFGGWRRAFPVHWRSFSSRVRRRAWQDDKAHHPCPISSLCPAFKRARNCWAVSFLFFH